MALISSHPFTLSRAHRLGDLPQQPVFRHVWQKMKNCMECPSTSSKGLLVLLEKPQGFRFKPARFLPAHSRVCAPGRDMSRVWGGMGGRRRPEAAALRACGLAWAKDLSLEHRGTWWNEGSSLGFSAIPQQTLGGVRVLSAVRRAQAGSRVSARANTADVDVDVDAGSEALSGSRKASEGKKMKKRRGGEENGEGMIGDDVEGGSLGTESFKEDMIGDDDDDTIVDDVGDDGGEWEVEYEEDDEPARIGDGGDGGGIVLGAAAWSQDVLDMARRVLEQPKYGGDFEFYAFRVLPERNLIRVRLDKLSDKFGSPSLEDCQQFLRDFNERVEQAGQRGELPAEIEIEVSTPGAERVLRVPQDLKRFEQLPMLVCYADGTTAAGDLIVREEILDIVAVDEEARSATWKLSNVRANREMLGKGKGRGLNKKQRDRRTVIEFQNLLLVRMFLDL